MFFSYTINYNLCTFQFAKVIKRNHLYNIYKWIPLVLIT
nr:MAG TPA: hypothetical protein [Crassvirales sp.]